MFNFLFKKTDLSVDINNDFIPNSVGSFLINLDRAEERLAFVKPNIDKLGFPVVRVSAIDGRLLSEEEIQKIVDQEKFKEYFNMIPEKGTIGCSLSHEKAWREFLKSKNEFALIFEDDVVFDPIELKECIQKVVEHKDLWDIVDFEMNHNGWPLKVVNLLENKELSVYLAAVRHAGCYIINRETVVKLLEKFYPIVMPLDHYFTAPWEFDIRFMGVEPRIVKQGFGDSQIKSESVQKLNNLKIKIKRAVFDIRRSVIGFLYNLGVYLKIRF